jgi:hypothetical protein
MKRSAKRLPPQMNLPLSSVMAAGNPQDQSEELTTALIELLIGAAKEEHPQPGNGEEDEPKAHA